MNILLIYPEFPDTFWSFKHALHLLRKRAAFPPLGLLTVAALLPPEWTKRLVDTNVQSLTDADLAWADYALIGAMTAQSASARRIIARCREARVPMVAGGPLFQAGQEDEWPVEHLVLNEAELTLPPFLRDLAEGRPQRVYATTAFADLRQTPKPMWELIDPNHYASMNVQFSRGCPFDCDFCNVTALLGHRVRTKTVTQVLAELDSLYALGWRDRVFFVDDNFIGNSRFLKDELLPAVTFWQRGKSGIAFCTEASINLADDPLLMEAMVAAGFDTVFVGIETTDDACLDECRKRQNRNRDLIADVKRIQRAGLQVQGGFIVGFDHDQPSIFQRQIEFIQTSGIVTAMVGLLQAPPGTRLYERMKREGRVRAWLSGDNVNGATNIVTTMNAQVLHDGYRRLVHHLYEPRIYYQRVRTLLREWRPPRVSMPFSFANLLIVLRSFFWLGLVGRERGHYWQLLLWTIFRRPQLLSQAIVLAITGRHFRKVCELHVK